LASREGEKYAIDGGAIQDNGAKAALAATRLVIEDEEVETKKKKKQRPGCLLRGFRLCCSCWWFTEPLEI